METSTIEFKFNKTSFQVTELGQAMIYRSFTICTFLTAALISVATAKADVVNFVLDSTQSSTDVTIAGVGPDQSQTSGTGVLNLTPSAPPFGVAQITDLDVVLDDGLFFDLGNMVTASTTAGNVTVNLITPGAAGTVSSNQFDQTGNLIGLGGIINVLDPLGVAGGNQMINLADEAPSLVDFNGVTLSRTGDIVTVSGTYLVNQTVTIGGNDVDVVVAGVFVGSGVVTVPEPSGMVVLLASLGFTVSRRRRS
jgi:hypothetical protein